MLRARKYNPFSLESSGLGALVKFQSAMLRPKQAPTVRTRWHYNGGNIAGPILTNFESEEITISGWAEKQSSLIITENLVLEVQCRGWEERLELGGARSKASLHSLEWELDGEELILEWSVKNTSGEVLEYNKRLSISDWEELEENIETSLDVEWIAEDIYPEPLHYALDQKAEGPFSTVLRIAGKWGENKRIAFDLSVQNISNWTECKTPKIETIEDIVQFTNYFETQNRAFTEITQSVPLRFPSLGEAEITLEELNQKGGLFFLHEPDEWEEKVSIQNPPQRSSMQTPVNFYLRGHYIESPLTPKVWLLVLNVIQDDLKFDYVRGIEIDGVEGLNIRYNCILRNEYTRNNVSKNTKWYDVVEWIGKNISAEEDWKDLSGLAEKVKRPKLNDSRWLKVLQQILSGHSYSDLTDYLCNGGTLLQPIDIGKSNRGRKLQENGIEFAIDPFTLRVFSRIKADTLWPRLNYFGFNTTPITKLEEEIARGGEEILDLFRLHLPERWMFES